MAAIDIDELRVDSYRLNHHAVDAFTADLTAYDPVDLARRLGLRRGELDLCAGMPPLSGFFDPPHPEWCIRDHGCTKPSCPTVR